MFLLRLNAIKCLILGTTIGFFLVVFYLNSSASYSVPTHMERSFNFEMKGNRTYLPGDYVKYYHPDPANQSYCTFNYKFSEDFVYSTKDVDYGPELGKENPYWIIYNVVEAKFAEGVPEVTYATHMSADFMYYLPELIKYWDGFISVAAFVQDLDVSLVREQLIQYCYCIPEMSRVSVHFVFHKKQAPTRQNLGVSKPSNCEVADSSQLGTKKHTNESIMYPINVCRNAARTAALTDNVIVSDIQLMPSEGLARKFLNMIEKHKLDGCKKRVYVLPIFEVDAKEEIPRTKKQLVELVKMNKSVYFHKLVCSHCQKFPGIETWLKTHPSDDVVKPLITAKREIPFHRWEPIYIGTKAEPFYNEILSWEGLQDKMLQMLEMCLMNYQFVILDGAFLIHWPGIKQKKDKNDEKWRAPFIQSNSVEYKKILNTLLKKHPAKPQCKAQ